MVMVSQFNYETNSWDFNQEILLSLLRGYRIKGRV